MYYVIFQNDKGNRKVVKQACLMLEDAAQVRDNLPERYNAVVVKEIPKRVKTEILDTSDFSVYRNGEKYGFVNHAHRLATTTFGSYEALMRNKNGFLDSATVRERMRERYNSLFGEQGSR